MPNSESDWPSRQQLSRPGYRPETGPFARGWCQPGERWQRMLSCQGWLWFLLNPISHSSLGGQHPRWISCQAKPLQSIRFSVRVWRDVDSSRDETTTGGTRSQVSLCRAAGNSSAWAMLFLRLCTRSLRLERSALFLSCYSLEGEISRDAPQ